MSNDIIIQIYKWIWFAALVLAMGGAIYLFVRVLYKCIKGNNAECAYVGTFYDKKLGSFRLKPTSNQWRDIGFLVGIYFLFRIITVIMGFVIADISDPSFNFNIKYLYQYITRWDAPHYIDIADHWYINEEEYFANKDLYADKEYVFIAFYPLFPVITRIFSYIFGSVEFSAYFVSNVCFLLSIWAMYKLVAMDFKRETAFTATLMLILSPYGFFFSFAFTESLFLFLTLMFFVMLKKEKWLIAGLFGFLAALTKNFGLLLVVPYGVWLIMLTCKDKYTVWQFVKKLLPGALVLVGFGVYLCINKSVHGEWFKFMEYQESHWFNKISCPLENVAKHMRNFLTNDNPEVKWFIWFGNIVALSFVTLSCIAFCKKIPFLYSIYSLAMIFLTLTVSWLLSGPRYLLVNFPVYIGLAAASQNKAWLKWLIIAVEVLVGVVVTVGYLTGSQVM